jgi:hypothetical protein
MMTHSKISEPELGVAGNRENNKIIFNHRGTESHIVVTE